MMQYTVAQLKRIYLIKVAVIFTIATFLINQGVEAMVIAEFIPVWTLKFSLIATAVLFPFTMIIAWVIINKEKDEQKETYEQRVLNTWLMIFSVLVLAYAVFDRLYFH